MYFLDKIFLTLRRGAYIKLGKPFLQSPIG